MSLPDTSRRALIGCLREALVTAGVDLAPWPDGPSEALSLDRDLGLDSFQLMTVARHLEKAYSFRFSVADWALAEEGSDDPSYRVGSLVDFMAGHLAR